MVDFKVDKELCTSCGLCAADCPARVISMEGGLPSIPAEKEAGCYRCQHCQHCLAICPTAAVSILGVNPSDCVALEGAYPEPDKVETLMRGRRSVRRYKDENLPAELISRLIEVASQAPSGMNARPVVFTLVDDKEALAKVKADLYAGLTKLAAEGKLPQGLEFFADFARVWNERGLDIIFRGAPHFIVATYPSGAPVGQADCMIALSYFELFAQSLGVGTVWDGLAKWAIGDLVPQIKGRLGIPQDHAIGYAMAFGWPAVKYRRGVRRAAHRVIRVSA